MRKITVTAVSKDEQQNVILLFTLENVSGNEIHECVVYGAQNVITKSTVNQWVQRFNAWQMSASDEHRSNRLSMRT